MVFTARVGHLLLNKVLTLSCCQGAGLALRSCEGGSVGGVEDNGGTGRGVDTPRAAQRVVSLLWCGNAAVAPAGFCPSVSRGLHQCFCCALRLCWPGLRQRVGTLVKETPEKVGNAEERCRRTGGSCRFVRSLLGSVSKTFSFPWCSALGKLSARAKAQIH